MQIQMHMVIKANIDVEKAICLNWLKVLIYARSNCERVMWGQIKK
jgi:hypothetical protein